VASPAIQGPSVPDPDPVPSIDQPPPSDVLAIPTGKSSVTRLTVANSIEKTSEPAPEPVEAAAPLVHAPDEMPLEKEWASNGAEVGLSGTRATAEPLPPEQLSSANDLTEIAAVTVESEPASSFHGDAFTEAVSMPKLSFWVRMKRLVIGR
jgi:hypothetical protein